MNELKLKLVAIFFLFLFGVSVYAQLTAEQIDSVVEKSMRVFNVPGMAVAVIDHEKLIINKAYGVQSVKTKKPVDNKTLFGIASVTKGFTTAALAQLVDQGKIEWDTKVRTIIPNFTLYSPFVSEEFTVRDLLVHRSGLGLGAGDLMVFPGKNTTTLEEMIHNLRYLKPVSSFRSKYDYDNLLYIVAGEIITRVSGISYREYIENNFFKPLGMVRATMDWEKIQKDKNRIDGHVPEGDKLLIAERTFTDIGDAAAGIYASIDDMVKYVQARINYGKYGKNNQDSLFSLKQAEEMWSPQTVQKFGKGDYNSRFTTYGLGWVVSEMAGHFQVSHTGGLNGIVCEVIILPDLEVGIIILTNQESGAAFRAISNTIKDAYFGIEGEDRIKQYHDRVIKNKEYEAKVIANVQAEMEKSLAEGLLPLADKAVVGTYEDNWFGKVEITRLADNTLEFKAEKSPDLVGEMEFCKGTTYVVRWNQRWLRADALVNFDLNYNGIARGFEMAPLSPLTDFSYDYQDLDFKKIE